MTAVERFLNYVKIDTQASETTGTTPSTEKQKNLGNLLVKELLQMGINDAHMDEFGNVYAHVPGDELRIGLNAHMDTALEVTDENVNPRLVKDYKGGTIKLMNGLSMSPKDFPILKNHIGHDLIVTDGNTLLGADDKAGIAIIMSVLQYFQSHPLVKHHTICVCFTVDEEIGEGPLHFNYEKMGAEFAYTIDGSNIDVIENENFNAIGVDIHVKGVSIHPGEGKGKLVNAILVMDDILDQIPRDQTPFDSSDKEGYYHITSLSGTSEEMKAHVILRDFTKEGIASKLALVQEAVNKIKEAHPNLEISMSYKEQYENMRTYMENKPDVINRAINAMNDCGITPRIGVIRGGTDGATFSKNGLPTPNLGTGSYNHHGRYEFLDVQEFRTMIKIVRTILKA